QAEIADQEDLFQLGDVYQAVTEKLIRRHPHVFGDAEVRDSAHVRTNWEAIKRAERAARGEEPDAESVLRGVPASAPALYQAFELGHRAARAGFDWPTTEGVLEKIAEEVRELLAAVAQGTQPEAQAELGGLSVVLRRVSGHL